MCGNVLYRVIFMEKETYERPEVREYLRKHGIKVRVVPYIEDRRKEVVVITVSSEDEYEKVFKELSRIIDRIMGSEG